MMPGRRWRPTADELAVLREAQAGRITPNAAAKRIGRHHTTVLRWLAEHEDEPPLPDPEAPLPLPEDGDLGGLWDALERVQAEYARLDPTREEVRVELPDEEAVLVVMTSDWHLGHREADLRRLREDLETIRDTPGVYAILGGDLLDNVVTAVAGRGMHHEQLAPTDIQRALVDRALGYLGRESVLAMVLGNHDAWSLAHDGTDPMAYLAKRIDRPYLGYFGFLTIGLGRQEYRLLVAHKFRMSSSFNKTHMAKRMMDFLGDADAVLVGDKHDPAAETAYVRRLPRFFGQAGSYLRSSRYGRSLGYPPTSPTMPGVVLLARERRLIGVFDALAEGIHVLHAFRGRGGACPCRLCRREAGAA